MKTYNKFVRNYSVTIPEVQRDYVQGANINKDKRDAFVDNILNHLEKGTTKLDLQFIYGSSKQTVENGKTASYFVPIDGQQRLTTLSMLGWYLSRRLNIYNDDSKEDAPEKLVLKAMDYRVRSTTQQFVRHLFSLKQYPASKGQTFSEWLEHEPVWFVKKWNSDPSIKAMIELIDYIDGKLANTSNAELLALTENLFNKEVIVFDTLDMEEYGLTEDLYVKMNARGKHLTEFENWKAEFYGFLKEHYGEEKAEEFSGKIEGEWGDFLWDYAIEEWDRQDFTSGSGEKEYPRIDEYFMRLFYNITDLICKYRGFDSHLPNSEGYLAADYEKKMKINAQIYKHEQYVKLLFNLIDAIITLRDLGKEKKPDGNSVECVKEFFITYLFSITSAEDPQIEERREVNIFNENSRDIDLISTLLKKNDFTIRPRLLLFGILFYLVRYPKGTYILNFIRVWWGYILNGKGLRQREKDGFTVGSNIRFDAEQDQRYNLLKSLLTLLKKENTFESPLLLDIERVQNRNYYGDASIYETDIIPLLNHPWLQFDIHILDDAIKESTISNIYKTFFAKFVSIPNETRVRQLINAGFSGYALTSQQLTFGLTGNWAYILTGENKNVTEALKNIMNDVFPGIPDKNRWITELVYKYIQELDLQSSEFAAFMFDKPYKVYSVPKGRAFKKNGYRLEPFAWVTAVKAGAEINLQAWTPDKFSGKMCRRLKITMYTEDSRHYGICFTDYGFQMVCNEAGWNINIYDHEQLRKSPLTKIFTSRFGDFETGLADNERIFKIVDNTVLNLPGCDRIETGVKFLQAISKLLA